MADKTTTLIEKIQKLLALTQSANAHEAALAAERTMAIFDREVKLARELAERALR